ncbi:MAG: ABC transporter permease [Psychrilyobacter sp.]|uniref:ABC transporter permease n=1 Tax=Psychrilyobacter sp. TaxID=2586924 RepID=UPI003C78A6BD
MKQNLLLRYIIKRLLMLIPVILGVVFIVFFILSISPNDPAANILGEYASKDEIISFRSKYGLDKPFIFQYLNFLKGLVTFNLGESFRGNVKVFDEIILRFPATLTLTIISMIVAVIIAIPAGIISAAKQYSAFDNISMVTALLGISIPNFWLGLMLILFFSVKLQWLPSIYQMGNLRSYIMPAIVLGTALSASTARMTRSSMLEVIRQDYITTARSKGLPEKTVILKHALKNALIPIITVVGLQFAGMLGGSAITEKVFAWPGLGSRIIDAQNDFDIPLILGGVVYIAIVISVVNLIVDLLYAVVDPKIRSRYKG